MFNWIIKRQKRLVFGSMGKNSHIYNPYIISHPQNLFCGNNTTILDNAEINMYPERTGKSCKITIGDNCYLGEGLTMVGGGNIVIGSGCLFAKGVCICSHNHGMNPESEIYYMDQPLTIGNVTIGEGCWLGENVLVLAGKTIGKKCIIGAGAVVANDIPDYSIAVGNPAKVIKQWNFNNHKWEKVY